jgi:hypothetical protein
LQNVLDVAARLMGVRSRAKLSYADRQARLQPAPTMPNAAATVSALAPTAGAIHAEPQPAASLHPNSAPTWPEPSSEEAEARCKLAHALHAKCSEPAQWLHVVLGAIVTGSSQRQALAGLIATGPARSLWYVGLKVQKRWKSLRGSGS